MRAQKRVIKHVRMSVLLCLAVLAPQLASPADTTPDATIDESLDHLVVKKWLQWNHQAVSQAFGAAPAKPYQVTVNASDYRSNSLVPWGQVNRGKLTNKIRLVINPDATYEQLMGDWTAYHEYSHLLIPYQGWGDLWFSEGLASYYQNILQYRMGVLTQEQAKQKLLAGLQRGIDNNSAPHLTLRQLSRNMRKHHAYMRVYWSGTWYFWSVDQTLREKGLSLDQALDYLNDCCAQQSLSAEQIVSKLDDYSGSDLFSVNFRRAANSRELAINKDTWRQLQMMEWPRQDGDQRGYLNIAKESKK
ncbi:MAG: hypothetical protein CL693_04590 [Cellvibrionaceae bacterium]|nr:hypothetical protein [Cellvibrionaceae bacterium]